MRPVPFLAFAIAATSCAAETPSRLLTQYEMLKVHTALLAPSPGVDEMPLWSPDSKMLAVNVQGKWYKVDLARAVLKLADWHREPIGVIASGESTSQLAAGDRALWQKTATTDPTKITDRNGSTFEFVRKDLGTGFVVSEKGHKPVRLWTSDLENCGELSLSPDGHWIAFVCEQNGVFVTSVDLVTTRK